jgi:hypothetical protein
MIAGRDERRAALKASGMTAAEAFRKRTQAERKAKSPAAALNTAIGRRTRGSAANRVGGMKSGGMAKTKKV